MSPVPPRSIMRLPARIWSLFIFAGAKAASFCARAAIGALMLATADGFTSIGSTAEVLRSKSDYLNAALRRTGNVSQGKALFADEQRLACSRCHSVDGTASKAGPDLFAVGDKLGRREIIESVLSPSAVIAPGYSATRIETRAGEEYEGIIKLADKEAVELMGADGRRIRIAAPDIREQSTGDTSLMPEGLQAGLTTQEFTDLIEYLVSLKQPLSANLLAHGMPAEIEDVSRPVTLTPFPDAVTKFEHPVWFGPVPGASNTFAVVEHESGTVWVLATAASGPHSRASLLNVGRFHRGTRGLLGIAFHPRFGENRKFYIARHIAEDGKFATLILEYEATPGLNGVTGAPRLLLRIDETTNVHYGGGLAFGPEGLFYIGMGDSGPQEDPNGHGQDTMLWLGKMLRIDVDHHDPGKPYSIPRDNPFVGRAGFLPEIWAYGFREPWRFSFDAATHELWVGDVGQDRYEEVDIVRRGENYGWNAYEGFEPFSNRYRHEGEHFVPPVFAYARKYGPSVTGGFVYRGKRNIALNGVYIFGDYESKRLWGLTEENRTLKTIRQIGRAPERVVSFGEDPDGELYVVGYEGTIFKMDLTGAHWP